MCGAVEGDAEHTFVDHYEPATNSSSNVDAGSNSDSSSDDNTIANNISMLSDVVKAIIPENIPEIIPEKVSEVLRTRIVTPERTVTSANMPETDTDLDDNGDEQAVDAAEQSQIDIDTGARTNGDVIVGTEVTDGSSAIIDEATDDARKKQPGDVLLLRYLQWSVQELSPVARIFS